MSSPFMQMYAERMPAYANTQNSTLCFNQPGQTDLQGHSLQCCEQQSHSQCLWYQAPFESEAAGPQQRVTGTFAAPAYIISRYLRYLPQAVWPMFTEPLAVARQQGEQMLMHTSNGLLRET